MSIVDRWHKSRPNDHEPRCRAHDLVPTSDHGKGDRWQVRYRDDKNEQRKKNFPKKTGRDPNVHASAFAAKIRDELNTGVYISPTAGKVTLATYAEQWRTMQTCDQATLEQITSRLKVHVYPKIGKQEMGVLERRPSLVQAWIKSLEPSLAPLTIRTIVGNVSTICDAAVEDSIIRRNPFKARSVRLPAARPVNRTPWTLPQLEAMSGALDERYRAMADLGAGCGHRQGELFGVADDDVDLAGRMIAVVRQVRLVGGELVFSLPKGGRRRDVPLPETVASRLSDHIDTHPPIAVTLPWRVPGGDPVTVRLLFVTAEGSALERNEFNRIWRAARAAAGIPNTRGNGVHVLRHTAASAWLAAGVDIRTVAEYLGHADPGFTLKTYIHLMPDSADRARKAMDRFFRGE